VRCAGVPKGHTIDIVSSHTGIAPTIIKFAGKSHDDFDGAAIPLSRRIRLKPSPQCAKSTSTSNTGAEQYQRSTSPEANPSHMPREHHRAVSAIQVYSRAHQMIRAREWHIKNTTNVIGGCYMARQDTGCKTTLSWSFSKQQCHNLMALSQSRGNPGY
jgi:hypothetical protein